MSCEGCILNVYTEKIIVLKILSVKNFIQINVIFLACINYILKITVYQLILIVQKCKVINCINWNTWNL